jgi:hypothetical protein
MMHKSGSKDGAGAGANTSFVLHEPEVGGTGAAHPRARDQVGGGCAVTVTLLGAHVPASSVAPLTVYARVVNCDALHWGDAMHISDGRETVAQGVWHNVSEYAVKFGGIHELP